MTVEFTFAETLYQIRSFRDIPGLESFTDYMQTQLREPLEISGLQMRKIRCTFSGYPIALVTFDELMDMMAHAIRTLGFDSYDSFMANPNDEEISQSIEAVLDHMETRILRQWRPSPSVTFERGTFAIDAIRQDKQLSILLCGLLYDAGYIRSQFTSLEDQVATHNAMADLADQIELVWHSTEKLVLEDLRSALIELDAKYRITKLQFSRKEKATFTVLAQSKARYINWQALLDFVISLTVRRDLDENMLTETSKTWTQVAFKNESFRAADRAEFSNLAAPHIEVKAKTPEQMAKAQKKSIAEDILKEFFYSASNAK